MQVANRSIEEVPPAISAVSDALVECKELVEFNLSNNAFGSHVDDWQMTPSSFGEVS
ncbi:hypothetical protein GALMADRAFT_240863 [Galerina marginata CBS 339.88]|uniref:Uncharacterized protein n=1 Tax=Galerina marginata (strain CBS 339.88) TaxID=685588 RepID=A0A067TDZ2_GALM3|nr:hypothetical protein GALMADRAFT_240863 [Galerina marginata CBS 339.88]